MAGLRLTGHWVDICLEAVAQLRASQQPPALDQQLWKCQRLLPLSMHHLLQEGAHPQRRRLLNKKLMLHCKLLYRQWQRYISPQPTEWKPDTSTMPPWLWIRKITRLKCTTNSTRIPTKLFKKPHQRWWINWKMSSPLCTKKERPIGSVHVVPDQTEEHTGFLKCTNQVCPYGWLRTSPVHLHSISPNISAELYLPWWEKRYFTLRTPLISCRNYGQSKPNSGLKTQCSSLLSPSQVSGGDMSTIHLSSSIDRRYHNSMITSIIRKRALYSRKRKKTNNNFPSWIAWLAEPLMGASHQRSVENLQLPIVSYGLTHTTH